MINDKELISIIIPIYNSSKYLERCLLSVINQTYNEIEIILINDGSTDNSIEICNAYRKLDSRIKIIDKQNDGVSVARNIGIDYSKGRYLMFVDSDDWIDKNAINEMYKLMKTYGVNIVKCNFVNENNIKPKINNVNELLVNVPISSDEFYKIVYNTICSSDFFNSVWGQLVDRNVIKNSFDKNLIFGEDYLFSVEMILNSEKIYITDRPFYHYFLNNTGICKNIEKNIIKRKIENITFVYERIIYILNCKINNTELKMLYIRFFKELILNYYNLIGQHSCTNKKILNNIFNNENSKKFIRSIKYSDYKSENFINKPFLFFLSKNNINGIIFYGKFFYNPLKKLWIRINRSVSNG